MAKIFKPYQMKSKPYFFFSVPPSKATTGNTFLVILPETFSVYTRISIYAMNVVSIHTQE